MEFLLLGPLEVVRDGLPLPVGQRRAERCLLGLLLLETGRMVPKDRLIDLLWDGDSPNNAQTILQTHASRLRSVLDPHRDGRYGVKLHGRNSGYVLEADPDTVDAFRFRAAVARAESLIDATAQAQTLRHALALWRGPVLADVATERLRDRIGTGLAELRLHALEMCMQAELDRGHHSEIIAELHELVTANPMRERLVGCLMLALYVDGRQAHALDVFHAARARIVEHTGLDPSAELVQLRDAIIRGEPMPATAAADTSRGQRRPPTDTVHSGGTRVSSGDKVSVAIRMLPRQLPAAPSHFVGREAELAALSSLGDRPVESGTVVISAMAGMAGIGKTALALHAGHRLAAHYPDGQLFIDLHGYSNGVAPVQPTDALDRFLRDIGVPGERIPAGIDERAALWRTVLAGKRMLIVLDNAAAELQVMPLLPGTPGCLVLITSRRRLTGMDSTHAVSLETLAQSDAVRLFVGTADRPDLAVDAPDVQEVMDLCGRLPLAIRIVAARLKHRPAWTVTDLAERLRDADVRLGALDEGPRSVHATLHVSYRHLSPEAQHLYRLLGLHPGPDIDPYAATALTDRGLEEVRRLLDGLVDDHLLQEPEYGRYRFHDLLRLHAADRFTHEETQAQQQAALARLLDYYWHTAAAAKDIVYPFERQHRLTIASPSTPAPVLADESEANRWLEVELANLLAAAQQAAKQGRPEYTWQLSVILERHLLALGRYRDALALHRNALHLAQQYGNRSAEMDTSNRLGHVYRRLGHYQQAVDHCRAALHIAQSTGDRAAEVTAMVNLGGVHRLLGRYEQADNQFGRALQIAQAIGDRGGELQALRGLGSVNLLLGRYEQADKQFGRALQIAQAIGDRRGELFTLTGLGAIQRSRGRYEQADEQFGRALRIAQAIGDRRGELYTLTGFGDLHRTLARHEQATARFEQALQIAQSVGVHRGGSQALTELRDLDRTLARYGEADRCYHQTLELACELGSGYMQYEALQGLGRLHHAAGHADLAMTYHEHGLQVATDLAQPQDQARAHDGLAHAHHAMGQLETARQHWQHALNILTSIGIERTEDTKVSVPNIRAHLADLDQRSSTASD